MGYSMSVHRYLRLLCIVSLFWLMKEYRRPSRAFSGSLDAHARRDAHEACLIIDIVCINLPKRLEIITIYRK